MKNFCLLLLVSVLVKKHVFEVLRTEEEQVIYYEKIIEKYEKLIADFQYPTDAKQYKPVNESIYGKCYKYFFGSSLCYHETLTKYKSAQTRTKKIVQSIKIYFTLDIHRCHILRRI